MCNDNTKKVSSLEWNGGFFFFFCDDNDKVEVLWNK